MKKLILFFALFPLLSYGQLYVEHIDLRTENIQTAVYNETLTVTIKSHSIVFKMGDNIGIGGYYQIKNIESKKDRMTYYVYEPKSEDYYFIDIYYIEKAIILNMSEALILTGDIVYLIENY